LLFIKTLLPKKNLKNIEASLSGYLLYHSNPDKKIFNLFQDNSLYSFALQSEFTNEHNAKRNLVRHICIALSYNLINLDNELLEEILTVKNKKLFHDLHFFFWNAKNHTPEIKAQIQPLWQKIFEKYKTDDNEDIKKVFLGKTSLWLENIMDIDELIYERIKFSVKYIDDRYNFIKSLNNHINKSAEKVANILLMLFKSKVEYDISRGIIQDMVKIIYEKGFKEQADKICILHADKGNYILRDLYTLNNKESQ